MRGKAAVFLLVSPTLDFFFLITNVPRLLAEKS
jgi:hypothetical protein